MTFYIFPIYIFICYTISVIQAHLAQRLEHHISNARVIGSNPIVGLLPMDIIVKIDELYGYYS
jgi:hypothetical protein